MVIYSGLMMIYSGLMVIYSGLMVIYSGLMVIYSGLMVIYSGLMVIFHGLMVIFPWFFHGSLRILVLSNLRWKENPSWPLGVVERFRRRTALYHDHCPAPHVSWGVAIRKTGCWWWDWWGFILKKRAAKKPGALYGKLRLKGWNLFGYKTKLRCYLRVEYVLLKTNMFANGWRLAITDFVRTGGFCGIGLTPLFVESVWWFSRLESMDIIPFHCYFLRQVSNACMIRTTQLFNKMSARFVWQTQILNCSIPIVFCFYIVSILQSFRIYYPMFFFMVISFLYPGSPSPNIQNGLKRMIPQKRIPDPTNGQSLADLDFLGLPSWELTYPLKSPFWDMLISWRVIISSNPSTLSRYVFWPRKKNKHHLSNEKTLVF